ERHRQPAKSSDVTRPLSVNEESRLQPGTDHQPLQTRALPRLHCSLAAQLCAGGCSAVLAWAGGAITCSVRCGKGMLIPALSNSSLACSCRVQKTSQKSSVLVHMRKERS